MSTLNVQDIYFTQSKTATPAPLEQASAGGPSMSSGKLPLASWVAFVVTLVVIRLLWEYSG